AYTTLCRSRDHAGWFPHHGVAVAQCGRDLPRRDRDREVEGRDDRDHADRFADHLDPFTGSRRRVDLPDGAQPLGTVEAEDLRGAPYLADPLPEGLALLPRHLR